MMAINIRQIISFFVPLKFIGNENTVVNKIVPLHPDNMEKDTLCWCNLKNVEQLNNIKIGTVIVPAGLKPEVYLPGCNYIVVDNPRQYFNEVLTKFFWKPDTESYVSDNAMIAPSAIIGKNPYIGANVVIKEDCVIGDNVRILNNTIIYPGTVIESDVNIGSNNVIGSSGFGYEKNKEGIHLPIPHIGNVVIRSHVEIGHHNCIDRAVLGSTVIGKNSKIHNFVQIAHGVQLGENCLLTASVTISGSTIVGNNCWFGPGVTVSNKLKIGSFSYLSIGTVVLADVPEGATIFGNPGRIINGKTG